MITAGTKSRFRWLRPRFELRTVFVVFTGLSVWIGWEARIVHERREAMAKATAAGDEFYPFDVTAIPGVAGPPIASIPFCRRLLGDVAIETVATNEANIDQLTRLFPEADVVMPITCGFEIKTDDAAAPASDLGLTLPSYDAPSGVLILNTGQQSKLSDAVPPTTATR